MILGWKTVWIHISHYQLFACYKYFLRLFTQRMIYNIGNYILRAIFCCSRKMFQTKTCMQQLLIKGLASLYDIRRTYFKIDAILGHGFLFWALMIKFQTQRKELFFSLPKCYRKKDNQWNENIINVSRDEMLYRKICCHSHSVCVLKCHKLCPLLSKDA